MSNISPTFEFSQLYVEFIYDSLSISTKCISYKDVFFVDGYFLLHIALNKIKYICISMKYFKHIRFINGMNTNVLSCCVNSFNVL